MDPEDDRPASEAPWLVPDALRILHSKNDLEQFESEERVRIAGPFGGKDFPCLGWAPIDSIVHHGNTRTSDKDILRRFLLIGSYSSAPNLILRFARQYGPLQVCSEHCIPVSRIPDLYHPCEQRAIEPLTLWLFYARKARATLSLGRALSDGEFGDPDDWQRLQRMADSALDRQPKYAGRTCWAPPDPLPVEPGLRQRLLARCIHEFMLHVNFVWVDQCNLRPILRWSTNGPRIGIFGKGMLGAVARQLLLTLARVGGLAFCSCGRAFQPKRRPRPNERSWCDKCRETGEDKRYARRQYEQRKRRPPRS